MFGSVPAASVPRLGEMSQVRARPWRAAGVPWIVWHRVQLDVRNTCCPRALASVVGSRAGCQLLPPARLELLGRFG